jgi:hypothetical protein
MSPTLEEPKDAASGLPASERAELDETLAHIRDNPLLYAAESAAVRVCL